MKEYIGSFLVPTGKHTIVSADEDLVLSLKSYHKGFTVLTAVLCPLLLDVSKSHLSNVAVLQYMPVISYDWLSRIGPVAELLQSEFHSFLRLVMSAEILRLCSPVRPKVQTIYRLRLCCD